MKVRWLYGSAIESGIMDVLAGLEKVFQEDVPNAKIQRCPVHVARNALCKVPNKMKKKIADRLRNIFYTSNRKNALDQVNTFVEEYESTIPSAVQSLKINIGNCLTFYSFPEDEWVMLRTTNILSSSYHI